MSVGKLTGLLFVFGACRSAPVIGEPGAASSAAEPSAASRPGGVAAMASSATPSAGRFHEPIADKPFPDGASDEMVCAAVHSSERDPWFRFGHIIPQYVDGTVWIGEGAEQDLNTTLDAIDLYAPRMFAGRGKVCSRGGLLVYVEGLVDGARNSTGGSFTVAELEAGTFERAPVAKQVLRERFVASDNAGNPRLLNTCTADANLCESLLQTRDLRGLSRSRGLCFEALLTARTFFAMTDRSWATRPDAALDERAFTARCEELAPVEKVCSILADTTAKKAACWSGLARKLGL